MTFLFIIEMAFAIGAVSSLTKLLPLSMRLMSVRSSARVPAYSTPALVSSPMATRSACMKWSVGISKSKVCAVAAAAEA